MPGGASSIERSFVSGLCGAWSVAMASIVPSASPAFTAATSSSVRSGEWTLNTVSYDAAHASVSEVVRRRLGGHPQSVGLGPSDQLDRTSRRHVQEVDGRTVRRHSAMSRCDGPASAWSVWATSRSIVSSAEPTVAGA